MPKKTKVIEVEENEPVGAQEVEEVARSARSSARSRRNKNKT
jgi:hypothetical protein